MPLHMNTLGGVPFPIDPVGQAYQSNCTKDAYKFIPAAHCRDEVRGNSEPFPQPRLPWKKKPQEFPPYDALRHIPPTVPEVLDKKEQALAPTTTGNLREAGMSNLQWDAVPDQGS